MQRSLGGTYLPGMSNTYVLRVLSRAGYGLSPEVARRLKPYRTWFQVWTMKRRDSISRPPGFYWAAATALLCLITITTAIIGPYSVLVLGPGLYLGLPTTLAAIVLGATAVSLAFGVLNVVTWYRPQLGNLVARWLFGITTMASFAYYAVSWEYGQRYQGTRTLVTLFIGSIFCVGITGALLFVARQRNSHVLHVRAHWVLFFWLVTFAFPWLGEMP